MTSHPPARAVAAAAVAWALCTACATAQEPAVAPVLRIGDRAWPAAAFATLLDMSTDGGPPMGPAAVEQFAMSYAKRYALARHAEQAGLADDPHVAERLALARDRILSDEEQARLRRIAPVGPDDVRAAYEADPHAYDEYLLSHILIRVDAAPPARRHSDAQALALARSLARQLRAGANFAALARRVSEDDDSRVEGGRLPSSFAKDIKRAVLPAISALAPQQVSAPVRSPDGYHLIRLEEKAPATFESSRRLVEFDLRDRYATQELARIQASMPVAFDAAAWSAALRAGKRAE